MVASPKSTGDIPLLASASAARNALSMSLVFASSKNLKFLILATCYLPDKYARLASRLMIHLHSTGLFTAL